MSKSHELKLRVEAKAQKIKAEIAQMRADAEGSKNETIEKMEAKLAHLNEVVKDGWENLTEDASAKINEWLK